MRLSGVQALQQSIYRHLFKAKEMLSQRLCVLHNLYFYNHLMQEIRDALDAGTFMQYRDENIIKFAQRI